MLSDRFDVVGASAATMGLCLEPDVEDACHVELCEDVASDPEHSRSVRKAAKMAKAFVEEKVSPLRKVQTTKEADAGGWEVRENCSATAVRKRGQKLTECVGRPLRYNQKSRRN